MRKLFYIIIDRLFILLIDRSSCDQKCMIRRVAMCHTSAYLRLGAVNNDYCFNRYVHIYEYVSIKVRRLMIQM